MKTKIMILIVAIISLFCSVTVLIVKHNQKYIMQDGAMLALTLDGKNITSFPSGTNYRVNVECKNAKGIWLADEWNLSIEKITGNVTCNIDFYSNPIKLKSEVESKATTVSLTNNAGETETSNRYTGKKPDNWVWFNNEKWRIIGSIPVCLSSSCNTKENLVKIIRSESIGGLLYTPMKSNPSWGVNTLYKVLNNYYYGKKDATGASPCYGGQHGTNWLRYGLCNYKEIGISNSATDYYGKMIKNVYWNTGTVSSTSTKITAAYKTETSTISVSGRIGLMSASDYGYATSGITYSSIGLSSLSGYTGSNWLYGQSKEWTLTLNDPDSAANYYSARALSVNYGGEIYNEYADSGQVVRPVVYLDSSIYIVSGDGTINNPYQIRM